MGVRDITNLPAGAKIEWADVREVASEHVQDEDMALVLLPSGIRIDAGQYDDVFRVDVIAQTGHWVCVESSFCKDTAYLVSELSRMAHKYSDSWYVDLAATIGCESEENAK